MNKLSQKLHLEYDGRLVMITSPMLQGKIPWDNSATKIFAQTRVHWPYVYIYPQGWHRTQNKVPHKRGKIVEKPLFKIHFKDLEKMEVDFLRLVD